MAGAETGTNRLRDQLSRRQVVAQSVLLSSALGNDFMSSAAQSNVAQEFPSHHLSVHEHRREALWSLLGDLPCAMKRRRHALSARNNTKLPAGALADGLEWN